MDGIRNYRVLLWSTLVLFILCLFKGINISGEDMVEVIPYLLKWEDPTLYSKDFYLNYVWDLKFFERSTLLYIFHYSPFSIEITSYFLFIFFALLMISSMILIFNYFLESIRISVVFTLLYCSFSHLTSIGMNELYNNVPVSSFFSFSILTFAFYVILLQRYIIAIILITLAAYIHPVCGMHGYIYYSLYMLFKEGNIRNNIRKLIKLSTIFFLFFIPYVYFLLRSSKPININSTLVAQILEFRIGHHFYPQYQGAIHWFIFILLCTISIAYFRKYNRGIMGVITGGLGLIILYSLGLTIFSIEFLTNSVLLISSVWLEFFSIVAVAAITWKFIQSNFKLEIRSWEIFITVGVLILILTWVIAGKYLHQETQLLLKEQIEISENASRISSKGDLFIIPQNFTYFKTIAKRSCYVDYKSIAHHPAFLLKWYERIQSIYNINIDDRRSMLNLNSLADLHLAKTPDSTLSVWNKNFQINYIIRPIPISESMYPILYRTKHYCLQKIERE
ncbi:MAG: hypothetical protein IPQ10_10825 [Saprospiraceae bacterium]|nr:hypothetical protein [Saprospiraceae bacterium]MBL0261533.1 hypothetical protein [Saprospiraceae bacterium]